MINTMYYDVFTNEYTLEIDPYAPPERYVATHRGSHGIYIEKWRVKKGERTDLFLEIAFDTSEYYDRFYHEEKVKLMCEENGCELIKLYDFTIPREKFDQYVERVGHFNDINI